MANKITKQDLINFEKDIADNYEHAKIRGPVHLCGGNEDELLEIFKKIKKEDWVFSTHRSHYHALLKSKNPEWVKKEIFAQRSSHINSKKYKIFTSAIVGGVCPIALGVALAIKKRRRKEKVWCFVGDMASQMGIFHECVKYAINFDLPITFVVEDNTWGVYTPTSKVWGEFNLLYRDKVDYYRYERTYPHYGIADRNGKKIWVNF